MMNEYMQYLAELIPERDSLKLVKDEAKKYYRSHSPDECYSMGIELYQSDNFAMVVKGHGQYFLHLPALMLAYGVFHEIQRRSIVMRGIS